MKKASNDDYNRIIDYLKKDLANCIYMYIDIVTYGLEGEKVQVWTQNNGDALSLVVMKYFDSIQIYTVDYDYDFDELLSLLKELNSPRINGPGKIISKLWNHYDNGCHTVEYGIIMRISNYILRGSTDIVEKATVDDVEGIAELIINEPELNGGFSKEELIEQFRERIVNNLGDSFIIKEDNEVVAHLCINAECDEFLVGAMTVVRPDKRDTLYGSMLDAYFANLVKEKGKDCYSFLKDPRRIKMFKAMKNEVVGEYGRIKRV